MEKVTLTIVAPTRHSWVDSFAPSARACPFSPRYRNLALKRASPPPLVKSASQPCVRTHDKENSRDSVLFRMHTNPAQNKLESIQSPRYVPFSRNRENSLRITTDLQSILSPRYTNMQGGGCLSPRYENLPNEEMDSESDSDSYDSESVTEDSMEVTVRDSDMHFQFTPFSLSRTPYVESDSEELSPVAKFHTVLALLENLDDSITCSDYDDQLVE